MSGEVIQFPGVKPVDNETVTSSTPLFVFNEHGQVDLADGVAVSDAVTAFWEAVGVVVKQEWEETALPQEQARTRLLTAYLDKVRPGWRQEVAWG